MADAALSRIPFRVEDEVMILSMARWMRLVGVVQMVLGIWMMFVVLVGLIYAGVALDPAAPGLGKLGPVLAANKLAFAALGVFALIMSALSTTLGYFLAQAADDFDKLARTDVADQDLLTAGLLRLKAYFKLSVMIVVVGFLVGLTVGLSLAVKYAAAP